MSLMIHSRTVSGSDRVYRWLLFFYPADHRREYGPLMAQLFRDHCRDALQQAGAIGLIKLWVNTLIDLITTVIIEHIAKLKGETMKMDIDRYEITLLQSVSEVSTLLITCLNLEDLMQKTVNLIQERFDFYYVGWFLVDEDYAVLQVGAGEVAPKMLEAGYRLAIGNQSIIGYSIANAKACIALDVGEDAVSFNNPWLPETRSELVLPLVIRGRGIGALTLQSKKEAAFSEEHIADLQAIVNQLGIAVENARQFSQVRQMQETVQKLRNQLPGRGLPIGPIRTI